MLKKISLKEKIICLMIIIQPIIAQITSIMVRKSSSNLTIGMLYNGLIFVFGITYILFISKSNYKKISVIYIFFAFIFFVIFFITKFDRLSISYIFNESIFLFKYWFFPIVFVFLINLFDDYLNFDIIKYSIKISLLIYCLLIVVAVVSGTSYLSYDNSYFGKLGWFYSSNEIGTLLSILLPYIAINFNKKSALNIVFILVPIVLLMIGTKVSIIGLILFCILIFLYFFFKSKIKIKILLLTILVFITSILCIFKPPAIKNIETSINNYILNSKNENIENGKISFLIFGERYQFFKEQTTKFKNNTLQEYLFGIGFCNLDETKNYRNHLVEMDYIDILYKYGIIGLIIYILPIVYLLYICFKRIFLIHKKIDMETVLYIYIFILSMIIAFVSGHLISAPAVSLFPALSMAILFMRFKKGEK